MERSGLPAKVLDGARNALIEHLEVVFGQVADDATPFDHLGIDANDGNTSGEGRGLGGLRLLGADSGKCQY